MSSATVRVQAGVPAGGQFAVTGRPESGTQLDPPIPGYTPGVGHTTRLSTPQVAAVMGADLTGLADNVTAFDIETDNSAGSGLDPAGGQITEVVLANSLDTVILAGDEQFILQGLADYLNDRPPGEVLVDWNGAGFDNPFLAVRGAMHAEHLEGWGLSVEDVGPAGNHYVCAGFEYPQAATWTRPDGGQHHDVDAMQLLKTSPLRGRNLRLKDNVRRFGADPIELDRTRLYEYTPQERAAYAASDGVGTLLAYVKLTA